MEANKNNTPDKSKLLTLITRYGAYIVLILCIISVAIAAAILLPTDGKKESGTGKSDHAAQKTPEESGDNNMQSAGSENKNDASAVSSDKDESLESLLDPHTGKPYENEVHNFEASTTPVPDFTAKPQESTCPQVLLNPPVSGEVIWRFAMDELIYSKTLDQWTTHSGVDIACKKGDSVRAVDAGVVESVYNDTAFGVTVVIKHKNGHITVYSNLAEDGLIKEGASVTANDVIGKCGDTSKFECESKSHVHFEYHVNEKPVDPAKYVRLTAK